MQNPRLTNRDDGNMVNGVRVVIRAPLEVVVAFPLVGHLVDETYSAEGSVHLCGTGYQPVNNSPLWRRRWRASIELSDPVVAKFLKRLELFAVTEIVRLYPNAEFVKAALHANGGNVNTLYQFLREQRSHMPLDLTLSANGSWVVSVEYPVVQSSKAAARGQVAQTCLDSVFSQATSKETVVYPYIKGYVNDGTEKGKAVTLDAQNTRDFTELPAQIQPGAPVAVWVQAHVCLNAAQFGIRLVVDDQYGMIFLPEAVRLAAAKRFAHMLD